MMMRHKSSKAVSTCIMAVCNAFTSSSEYYSQLKDIHLAGLVIYVGTDNKACQALGIFGGSLIKNLVNEGQADLNIFTPQITAQKFSPELCCEDGEAVHNHNRHVAPLMMLDKFVQVIDWPASVPPVGGDFVFKDLNTGELKALVVPYLKHCMGQDYGAKLV
ncbi:hypothetical protein K503DRAFT_786034 [Rhizopogon vinicolor AM-OR11-026]|uniref:Uncharacterized protein n=1 Tax=Rhizopogon vinicolor AM-OR11-026 TaxID=1314800 RepID=A0A1B7MNB7_9AGAM|nr:hypothetical protein K503DRAFT_786034 [Rhizopogon vinicolor AM-OR11-026]